MAKKIIRPPAVPLIVCDPYLSIWSEADNLYDDFTRHWTGAEHPLSGYIRIDGRIFRFLGHALLDVPLIPQKNVEVYPTKTIYTFANDEIKLTLTFLSPCLPHNLDLFSWPLSYISFSVVSLDKKSHSVSLYFDAYADIATHSWEQQVDWGRYIAKGIDVIRVGTVEQPILKTLVFTSRR
jgi:hypothetical protein